MPSTTEDSLARELLLKYFFVDPAVIDPHRVQLSSDVLDLLGDPDGKDLEATLREIAKAITPGMASQIVKKAINALRFWRDRPA